MLVLSRKIGESFVVGHDITVTVVRINGSVVRLGIEAPDGSMVVRHELLARTEAEDAAGPLSSKDAARGKL